MRSPNEMRAPSVSSEKKIKKIIQPYMELFHFLEIAVKEAAGMCAHVLDFTLCVSLLFYVPHLPAVSDMHCLLKCFALLPF